MHDATDVDRMAASFLAHEPDYDQFAWVDMYANTLGRLHQHLSSEECTVAGRAAFARAVWSNPKVTALLDAQLGPSPSLWARRR